MKKKLLIVAYHFAPFNNIASKRWNEMTLTLEKEFDVYLFTHKSEGDLNVYLNESKIKRVGFLQKIQFQQNKSIPSIKQNIISYFLKNFRTLGPIIYTWYFKNKDEFENYLNIIQPDIIITTVNPFATAFFGLIAKKRDKNITWIIDIRDSISLYNDKQKNFILKYLDRLIDKYIIKKADIHFTVSDTLSSILSKFYSRNFYTIYNGYNKYQILDNPSKQMEKITLYYAGKIYKHQEEAFLLLLSAIKKREDIIFNIRLLGNSNQFNQYNNYLKKHKINNVFLKKPIDNKTIILEEKDSDILIIFEDMDKKSEISKGTLTGKLFEYLASSKPILAICRDDSEIGDILSKTKRGNIAIKKEEIFNFIKNKENYILQNENNIVKYSRDNQAKKAIQYINLFLKEHNNENIN